MSDKTLRDLTQAGQRGAAAGKAFRRRLVRRQLVLRWLWRLPVWLHTLAAQLSGGWRIVRYTNSASDVWYAVERS